MSLDRLINLLVTIAVVELMVLSGLKVTLAEIARSAGDWRLLARAALANYLPVPALAIVLLLLFDAAPMVAAAFLVLAVCPGAPFGSLFAGIARADVPQAVGLMVILAGSSAIVSPLLLLLLVRLFGREALRIDPLGMVGALLIAQLLPLLFGLLLRHRSPRATRAPARTRKQDPEPRRSGGDPGQPIPHAGGDLAARLVGMLMLLSGTLAIGWLAGAPRQDARRTMALTTALRNVGVGLVIVTGSFAGTSAVSAALAYGIVEVLGSLLVALWWPLGKMTRHQSRPFRT
jgi:BASS family bile acid:Na+ symporter